MERTLKAATAHGTGTPTPAGTARAAGGDDDRVLEVGWKYDPARDRLGPGAVVYTWYRDAQRRADPVVSYILIARYAPCGPAAPAAR